MKDFESLFSKDSLEQICSLIDEKSPMLLDIPSFKEKDKNLATSIDQLEQNLPKELKDKFDNVMKLNYQLEEYYLVLAYYLGMKYGKNLEQL